MSKRRLEVINVKFSYARRRLTYPRSKLKKESLTTMSAPRTASDKVMMICCQ
jgi:hypothetical protein